MNKIYLIISVFISLALNSIAQKATLFVNNAVDNSNAIELRIFTVDMKNKNGINIYRKSNSSRWHKLNNTPIIQKHNAELKGKYSKETIDLMEIINSDENTSSGMIKIVLILKLIQNKELADAVGLRFIDSTVVKGENYSYKIVDAKTGKKIASSSAFTSGKYNALAPPDSIKVYQENNSSIAFEWKAEKTRFYAINIYRSSNGNGFSLLNDEPILLSKIRNKKGDKVWPKTKYIDDSVRLGSTYRYKIEALDYFGNPGELSTPWSIDFKDIIPPPPTKRLFAKIDDKTMGIELSWKNNKAKDILGYNAYYSMENDSAEIKANTALIQKDSLSFSFNVNKPGKYNAWVEAVDSARNMSKSDIYSFSVLDKKPPEVPSNLYYELKSAGKVKLMWQSEVSGDFMTYRVYRKESNARHYVLISANDFDSTSFIDQVDLSVKNAFQYYVIAMDTLFNKSEKSNLITVKLPDVTAPGKPFLKNIEFVNDKITLSWRANKDEDLAGYNVFYFNKSDTTKVNTELIQTTMFIDNTTHSENDLQYKISAVDSTGNESDFSNPFLLKKAYKSMADGAFTKLKIKTKKGSKKVNISWKFKEGNIPKGFIIYRANSDGKFKSICGLQSEMVFVDNVAKIGAYKYKVVALYSSGDKSASQIKEVTVN